MDLLSIPLVSLRRFPLRAPLDVRRGRWSWTCSRTLLLALLAALAVQERSRALDCNRNGIEDSRDLVTGGSRDCNRNGVPDECDVLPVNLGFLPGPVVLERSRTAGMAAADLDGDGLPDLVVLEQVAGQAAVLRGDGAGGFAPAEWVPAPAGATSLVAGDLDDDGWPDLAAVGPSELVVLLNREGRGLAPPARVPLPAGVLDLVRGDLDGDRDPDLAVVRRLPGTREPPDQVGILLNEGDGSFPEARWFAAGRGAAFLVSADLEGDGDLDLAAGSELEDSVTVLRAREAGSFDPEELQLPEGSGRSGLHAGDLDGDGDQDLVVINISAVASVLRNDGSGRFAPGGRFETEIGWGYPHTTLADLDGDGDLDIAASGVGAPSHGLLATLLNDGGAEFRKGPRFILYLSGRLLAADLDGGGDRDLAVSTGPGVALFWNHLMSLSGDCDGDGIPDECGRDCDANGVADSCDIAGGAPDCDADGLPDRCEPDCNRNGAADDCDIASGASEDRDADGLPDECQDSDCDGDGFPDRWAVAEGAAGDCNRNGVPDPCDVAARFALDVEEHFGGAVDLLLSDLDGDSHLDLVALREQSFEALLADRRGGYLPAGIYRTPARAAAAGDLDGDGDQDLAVAGAPDPSSEGKLTLLMNRGAGSFQRGARSFAAGLRPTSVAVLDRRNRLPDLAVGSAEGVWLFRNRGDGAFEPGEEVDEGGGHVVSADLDGDGDGDLATDRGVVLLRRGEATFHRGTHHGVVAGGLAADLDGDRDLDLLSSPGWVGLNAGDGTFTRGKPLPSTGSYHGGGRGLAAGDIDGDLDIDVLLIQDRLATVFRNLGGGEFEAGETIPGGLGPAGLALGDLDRDGDLDLAVASADSGSISIHRNRGDGTLDGRVDVDETSGTFLLSGAVLDLDGDGDLDLLHGGRVFTRWFLRPVVNRGGGRFEGGPRVPLDWKPSLLAAADLDGNGPPEVIGADRESERLTVLWLQGGRQELPAGGGPHQVTSGDLDGDGDLDLVAALEEGAISIIRNAGPGGFEAPRVFPLPSLTAQVLLLDLERDGDLDLVTGGGPAPGGLSILLNDGSGTLDRRVDLALDARVASLAGGDLDGDGDPDILAGAYREKDCSPGPFGGCRYQGLFFHFRNDGAGTLELIEARSIPYHPRILTLADLDGDGDLDLAAAGGKMSFSDPRLTGHEVQVLLNSGDGTLTAASRVTAPANNALVAADLDGDGSLDLAGFSTVSATVLFNRTRSRSRDTGLDGIPDECQGAVFRRGDARPDGRLDLADALSVLGFLFLGGLPPPCLEAADADGSGRINVSDAVFILRHLFRGGPSPPAPGPPPQPCGADPDPPGSRGDLGCRAYDGC